MRALAIGSARGRSRAWLLLALPALAGCLSAFAPAIFARREHAGLRHTSTSSECLGCHAVVEPGTPPAIDTHVADAQRAHAKTADAPVVPRWMLDDRRGCAGCHAVLGAR